MSKILIVTNHSYMLYRFRLELLEELAKTSEVVISTPFVGHEDDLAAQGFRLIETAVDRRGINPKTDAKLLAFYFRLLKRERPNLVITYSIKPNIYAGLACSALGIPYCANVQGLGTAFERKGLAEFVTALYKAAFRKVKTVFFENEADAAVFCSKHILSAEKQTVLNGAGINLERYALQPYPTNDVMHFLYLGRLMQEKGMDELFAAARRLRSEGYPFVLDLVGFFEDEYKAQVEQLQADGIAVFHGFQAEPRPYYAAADCVVLPSYHEGMSNVLLEAAASGRPIITSDIPGCREAVDDGVSGFLCRVRDADSLCAAMRRFLELDTAARETMGVAGRKLAEERFDKDKVVASTIVAMGI